VAVCSHPRLDRRLRRDPGSAHSLSASVCAKVVSSFPHSHPLPPSPEAVGWLSGRTRPVALAAAGATGAGSPTPTTPPNRVASAARSLHPPVSSHGSLFRCRLSCETYAYTDSLCPHQLPRSPTARVLGPHFHLSPGRADSCIWSLHAHGSRAPHLFSAGFFPWRCSQPLSGC
jgi:hypothetical protein